MCRATSYIAAQFAWHAGLISTREAVLFSLVIAPVRRAFRDFNTLVLSRGRTSKCLSALVFPWSDAAVIKRTRLNTTVISRARSR